MDELYSNTENIVRKRGKHLTRFERGSIAELHVLGFSNGAIAKRLNCSPFTIGYELARGTSTYLGRGRKPQYSPKKAQAVYNNNRKNCHRRPKNHNCKQFLQWLSETLYSKGYLDEQI